MSQEVTSLTAPQDATKRFEKQRGVKPLTESQLEIAVKEKYDDHLVENYPEIDRRYIDPEINGQKFFLVSFVPSKGASPDKHGIYGFAKVRGCYDNDDDAFDRARFIIQNVDSYHPVRTGKVGYPFPLTEESKYSRELDEVDLKKNIKESTSKSVKEKRNHEKREVKKILEREKNLQEEVDKEDTDPLDVYIKLRCKKAQLLWDFVKNTEVQEKRKEIVIKTRAEIKEMEAKHVDLNLESQYKKKFYEARKQAGLKNTGDNFMKFLEDEPENLGF